MLIVAPVHELSKCLIGKSATLAFFFWQSNANSNNAASVLRGLIWKLARNYFYLAQDVFEKYKAARKQLSKIQTQHFHCR